MVTAYLFVLFSRTERRISTSTKTLSPGKQRQNVPMAAGCSVSPLEASNDPQNLPGKIFLVPTRKVLGYKRYNTGTSLTKQMTPVDYSRVPTSRIDTGSLDQPDKTSHAVN